MSADKKHESPVVVAVKDIVAGSLGGIAQCLSGHPLDTIKVRLQTQPTNVPILKYNGTLDCFKKIVAEEGVGGLYKGVQSPLLGMAVMNSVLFLSYGQSKALLQKVRFKDDAALRSKVIARLYWRSYDTLGDLQIEIVLDSA